MNYYFSTEIFISIPDAMRVPNFSPEDEMQPFKSFTCILFHQVPIIVVNYLPPNENFKFKF